MTIIARQSLSVNKSWETSGVGQQLPALPPAGRRLAARYGEDALCAGYTAVPNTILRYKVRLGLSCEELEIIVHLCSHWRDFELPCLTVGDLAAAVNLKVRQTQAHLAALRHKGYLATTPGARRAQTFDLRPLFEAATRMFEQDRPGAVDRSDGCRPATPCVQSTTPSGQRKPRERISKEKHEREEMIPPYPQTSQLTTDVTPDPLDQADKRHESTPDDCCTDPLSGLLGEVSAELGDIRPEKSLAVARRLAAECLRGDQFFAESIREARLRTRQRKNTVYCVGPEGTNAMPYFWAVLSNLLTRDSTEHQRHHDRHSGHPHRARPRVSSADTEQPELRAPALESTESPTDTNCTESVLAQAGEGHDEQKCHALWHAVLTELADVMTPENVARCARARPLRQEEGVLYLAVPDPFLLHWLARLGPRLDEALDCCGHRGMRVAFDLVADAA